MIWLGAVLNSHGLDLLEGRLASSAPLLQVDPQVLSILPTLEVWQFLYLCHCRGCACFLLPMCLYLCFHKYSVLWYSFANIKGQTDLLVGFLHLFCLTLVFLWLQGLTFPLGKFLVRVLFVLTSLTVNWKFIWWLGSKITGSDINKII